MAPPCVGCYSQQFTNRTQIRREREGDPTFAGFASWRETRIVTR
jgi:hypothetical protein